MLNENHWLRAILEESLAVMTVDTEASRNARGPWGLLKLQQHSKKTNLQAIHIVLDRLFIWFPVQCGIDIMRHVAMFPDVQTKYRLPKPRGEEEDSEKFSFYGIQGKKTLVVLDDLRPHFPWTEHLFRAGVLTVTAAQAFSREVSLDFVVDLPLFNPLILERQGNCILRNQLPSKWVLNGNIACLIAEDLKHDDEDTFLGENRRRFLYREPSPFQVVQENN